MDGRTLKIEKANSTNKERAPRTRTYNDDNKLIVSSWLLDLFLIYKDCPGTPPPRVSATLSPPLVRLSTALC